MKRFTARNQQGLAYFPECFKEPCNGGGCQKEDCPFITQVCQKLADLEDEEERREKGCFWCKEQTDEFRDTHMTASTITVISQDRFGKREIPRNFCPFCGRKIKEETT